MEVVLIRDYRSRFAEVLIAFSTVGAIYYTFAKMPLLAFALGASAIVLTIFYYGEYEKSLLFAIDDDGLFDARLGVGKIPWNEIADVRIELCYNTRFICLHLRDPDRFLKKIPRQLRDKFVENHTLGFTSLNVNLSGLNISPLQLQDVIKRKIRSYG